MNPKLETITPAIAAQMLKENTCNRPLEERNLAFLIKELKFGRWKINGDMIRFSDNNVIIDGQHRLFAVVRTGVTIKSYVIYGLPADVFNTIDVGKRRSGGDTLGCLGEPNACRMAAALIMIDKYMTKRVEKSPMYSNTEMVELLSQYPEVRDSINTHVKGKKVLLPSVMDACHYLFSRKNPEAANRFMERVLRGSGLAEGEPEYVLRERLVSNSLRKAKLSKAHIFALCISAWNHSQSGKTINHLKLYVRDGKLIEFPEVQ